MSKIIDRYTSAVHSSNLKSKPDTTYSDTDVLGAAGLAAKQSPLGVALLRLFTGDNNAATAVINALTHMIVRRAYRTGGEIGWAAAELIATIALEWHRDKACRVCGGHGFKLIPGTPSLSDRECDTCRGSGERPFNPLFPFERLDLALWAREKIDREQRVAGAEAMKALAPSFSLDL